MAGNLNNESQTNKPIDFSDPEILEMMYNDNPPDPNYKPLNYIEVRGGGHVVNIKPYQILSTAEERVINEKLVKKVKVGFVFKYSTREGDIYWWCVDNCDEVIRQIANTVNSNVSIKRLTETINSLINKYSIVMEVSVVDYVKQNFPHLLEEIERDPFKWILDHMKGVEGYEKLKIAGFLAILSTRLLRVNGIYRLHLMVVGNPRAGKSTALWSVASLLKYTDILVSVDDVTPNILVYNSEVDNYDGKVLFIEQIDGKQLNQLLELMTKDGICKTTTVKVRRKDGTEGYKTETYCKPGQPVVITTSVLDNMDIVKLQRNYRFFMVYGRSVKDTREDRIEAIGTKYDRLVIKANGGDKFAAELGVTREEWLAFLAYLFTRPTYAVVGDLIQKFKELIYPLGDLDEDAVNVATEWLRILVVLVAIARGKTKADEDDLNFVLKYFKYDIIFNGLGFSEREYVILKTLFENGGMMSYDIYKKTGIRDGVVSKLLMYLKQLSYVKYTESERGSLYIWNVTDAGTQVIGFISELQYKDQVNEEFQKLISGEDAEKVKTWTNEEMLKVPNSENLVKMNTGSHEPKNNLNQNAHIECEQNGTPDR